MLAALGLTEAETTQVQSAIDTGINPSESTSPLSSTEDLPPAEDPTPLIVVAPRVPTPVQAAGVTTDTAAGSDLNVPSPVPVEINGGLTTHPTLPVSSLTVGSELRCQQIYRGFSFDIPRASSVGPFYVVTRGKRVGAFSTWCVLFFNDRISLLTLVYLGRHHTSTFVTGVSRACYTRTPSLYAAITRVLEAINLGEAECIV